MQALRDDNARLAQEAAAAARAAQMQGSAAGQELRQLRAQQEGKAAVLQGRLGEAHAQAAQLKQQLHEAQEERDLFMAQAAEAAEKLQVP